MKSKAIPQSAIGNAADPIITKKPTDIVRNYTWDLQSQESGRVEGYMITDDPDYLYFIGRENSLEPTKKFRSFMNMKSLRHTIEKISADMPHNVYHMVVSMNGQPFDITTVV